jgi:hypothetical protein
VSGLVLSSGSSSSSTGSLLQPAAPEQVRRPVQDRLIWQHPKLSCKAAWRRRKREQQLTAQAGPFRRSPSPVMSGHCYRCLEPGHPKRGCTNDEVCIRCTDEGHGSGKCKRPRSPASEDELRRIALAMVARRRGAPRAGSPAAVQLQGLASGTPAPPPAARQDLLPVPSPPEASRPAPARWPSSQEGSSSRSQTRPPLPPCIIPRGEVVADLERRLRFSLVAYVGGSHPAVSCNEVKEALVWRARIPHDAFSVHKYKPEDFLVVFDSAEFRDRVAALPSIPHKHFTLFFRRWTRLAQAQKVTAGSLVHLAIEGISPMPGTVRRGRFSLRSPSSLPQAHRCLSLLQSPWGSKSP